MVNSLVYFEQREGDVSGSDTRDYRGCNPRVQSQASSVSLSFFLYAGI